MKDANLREKTEIGTGLSVQLRDGVLRTDRNVISVHSCKGHAPCASLATLSTTSPVLRCSKRRYSRRCWLDIALFICMLRKKRGKKRFVQSAHQLGLCGSLQSLSPLALVQRTRCNQAAPRIHLAWLRGRQPWRVNLFSEPRGSIALQVISKIAQVLPHNSTGHRERSWKTTAVSPPGSVRRSPTYLPVMSQPISPSVIQCYVSLWYLSRQRTAVRSGTNHTPRYSVTWQEGGTRDMNFPFSWKWLGV